MRSLGLDVGDRKIGVAISDPQGILAIPLTTIKIKDESAAIADIAKLAEQYEVERIVVGLPYSLDGSLGQQAEKIRAFTEKLSLRAKRSNLRQIDIQLWDERLSSVAAERLMVEAGTKRDKRKQHLDAMAAAFILQGFLDSLRA